MKADEFNQNRDEDLFQRLAAELSDLTVSDELIQKTLNAIETQEKQNSVISEKGTSPQQKKKYLFFRRWGGMVAAAACLALVAGAGILALGKSNTAEKSNCEDGGMRGFTASENADSFTCDSAADVGCSMDGGAVLEENRLQSEWLQDDMVFDSQESEAAPCEPMAPEGSVCEKDAADFADGIYGVKENSSIGPDEFMACAADLLLFDDPELAGLSCTRMEQNFVLGQEHQAVFTVYFSDGSSRTISACTDGSVAVFFGDGTENLPVYELSQEVKLKEVFCEIKKGV